MGTLRIDAKKCRGDGFCVAICPGRLLKWNEDSTVPVHIPEAHSLCIDCYHCVASCPHGALTIGEVDAASCLPLEEHPAISLAQTAQFLRSRRSIRAYGEQMVDKELLSALIKLASHAPAGHNRRVIRWTVVHDPDEVQRLSGLVVDWAREMLIRQPEMAKMLHMNRLVKGWEAGIDTINRHAPHLAIVHASGKNRLAQSSAYIALTYLELAAHAQGIGTCWAGYFGMAAEAWEPLQKALPFKEGDAVYGAMMLGYPRFSYYRLPPRPTPEIKFI